ncbi:uncharacterized protein PV09_06963 [Verruconis gallopava]|uniref:GH16 domain-containing protein n=1 Tax=Verruconis gallopava TaxID=253628 RepID=A0A0D1XHR8_9PEZI|nr:uncharacterized protein PV09_06963 [Verruconis gallopava]KIW01791.1 hypothetical protein PV09_06963 [Verruconis gallopava]
MLELAAGSIPCTSFSVNGSKNHFEYYRFYDFRDITSNSSSSEPGSPLPRSLIVSDGSWVNNWTIREEFREPSTENAIPMAYVKDNIFIENGALNFVTRRENATYQSAAELDFTAANFTYGSLRVSARVSGNPGAVAGIFTYYNDTQESDVEVLTRDPPGRTHFSNQPTTDDNGDIISGSTFNTSSPSYTNWNVYRLDWLPGQSKWYVDGKQLAKTTVHVPSHESMFILNLWSNAGPFSGSMVSGGSASMQVQWIEMAFNASPSNSAGNTVGGVVCSIDKSLGSPVPTSAAPMITLPDLSLLGATCVLVPLLFDGLI